MQHLHSPLPDIVRTLQLALIQVIALATTSRLNSPSSTNFEVICPKIHESASLILYPDRLNPNRGDVVNWASEASPTLGCSIEILRDIYCMYICYSTGRSDIRDIFHEL